jgi:hypothetical protein
MVLSISKRSRARLQRVPDLARVVERAIQITTEDLRVQKGLRHVSGVADPFGGIDKNSRIAHISVPKAGSRPPGRT